MVFAALWRMVQRKNKKTRDVLQIFGIPEVSFPGPYGNCLKEIGQIEFRISSIWMPLYVVSASLWLLWNTMLHRVSKWTYSFHTKVSHPLHVALYSPGHMPPSVREDLLFQKFETKWNTRNVFVQHHAGPSSKTLKNLFFNVFLFCSEYLQKCAVSSLLLV